MVQVDIFWSYALGAGFAVAASRQLVKDQSARQGPLLENRFFVSAVLYLALLFAPSGICLLWAFPSWETMHAGDRNLPAWLVTIFAVTNVTQGILGFMVVRALLNRGRRYFAFLQMVGGYFFMFFILVHGWDGFGYRRFFSVTRDDFLSWKATGVFTWLVSDVALTLYLMGLVLIPVLLLTMSGWLIDGYRLAGPDEVTRSKTIKEVSLLILYTILGVALGLAIAASLLVHLLGWTAGWIVFAALAYSLVLRKNVVLGRLADALLNPYGTIEI